MSGILKFSEAWTKLFRRTVAEARALGHEWVGVGHVLLAMIDFDRGAIQGEIPPELWRAVVFTRLGEKLRALAPPAETLKTNTPKDVFDDAAPLKALPQTPLCRRMVDRATDFARELTAAELTPDHVLLALLGQADSVVADALKSLHVDRTKMFDAIYARLTREKEARLDAERQKAMRNTVVPTVKTTFFEEGELVELLRKKTEESNAAIVAAGGKDIPLPPAGRITTASLLRAKAPGTWSDSRIDEMQAPKPGTVLGELTDEKFDEEKKEPPKSYYVASGNTVRKVLPDGRSVLTHTLVLREGTGGVCQTEAETLAKYRPRAGYRRTACERCQALFQDRTDVTYTFTDEEVVAPVLPTSAKKDNS